MSRNDGRDPQGRLHPSKAVRLKVLRRCTVCGADLLAREVRLIRSPNSPLDGALAHTRNHRKSRLCGPVSFAENPAYRKQAN